MDLGNSPVEPHILDYLFWKNKKNHFLCFLPVTINQSINLRTLLLNPYEHNLISFMQLI